MEPTIRPVVGGTCQVCHALRCGGRLDLAQDARANRRVGVCACHHSFYQLAWEVCPEAGTKPGGGKDKRKARSGGAGLRP